uniref:CUB domain-containing protein n=1 Tax=Steinernema glaseri TaxID=37863 RepID=A0A1I8AIW5_9BILA
MNIRCSNGVNARIEFKCDKNGLSGTVTGPMGQVKISGSWDRAVYKHGVEGRECIFEAPPPLPNASRYYGFNRFSMTLNEMFPEEMAALPPTDSRFRPDQRHLENGDAQKGTAAKQVVEQNQRSRARLPHRQLWFSKTTDSFTNCDLWVSQGKYWQAKEEGFRDAAAAMVKIFAM